EVGGVAHHVELGGNAVAAVHVTSDAGDLQRLAAIVALHHADRFWDWLTGREPAADAQGGLEAERDFGRHVGELQLNQLVGGEGAAELLPVQRILPRRVVTRLGSTPRS